MIKQKSRAAERREQVRKQHWSTEDAWTGENEKGWFFAPRTLPLILALLETKELSGNKDVSKVYLELLARHIGGGVIEMTHEVDHAYAAGYLGTRALRTWKERIKTLEKNGFIMTKRIGNRLKYILLVHPTSAVHRLRANNKVSDEWWDAYSDRQKETKEASFSERQEAIGLPKVLKINANKSA